MKKLLGAQMFVPRTAIESANLDVLQFTKDRMIEEMVRAGVDLNEITFREQYLTRASERASETRFGIGYGWFTGSKDNYDVIKIEAEALVEEKP